MDLTTLERLPLWVNGRAFSPSTTRYGEVTNPATGEVIRAVPFANAADVDAAVKAAAAAFPAWRNTPAVRRARVISKFRDLVEKHQKEIAALISEEHGKVFLDAMGSVQRGIEVVEFAVGAPELLKGAYSEQVGRGVDAHSRLQPLGVCAGITPLNFPAMVPMWMFPMALACGNTFVLKPSEKDPSASIRMAELLKEAGLPKGVLNVVPGGRESVDALLTHPKVKAISFVGSSPVGKHIYETGTRHGKRVQANGGAKNYIVVMPDADVPRTVEALSTAAFGCAGERCMAGSTAIAVGAAAERMLPSLVQAARSIRVGPTDVEMQPDMGPVITAQHRDRVASLVASGEKEGAKIICDGRGAKIEGAPNGFYMGATIVDEVRDEMTIAREEVFGPVLNVMRMDHLDHAIEMANRSAHGNGAAIFTQSGKAAREFKHRVKAGMVGINVGVPATMAMFPFTGWDESFYGDLHIQGKEGVQFYTQQKVVTTRWFGDNVGDVWQK